MGDVLEIAERVRASTVTASAVLESYLDRLLALNSTLNAVVATRIEAARADAGRIDRAVADGQDPGPLAGVPFTVKDVLATVDLPTTCGSRAMAGHRTSYDATAVARLRAAGAILVGKTNTPEFAFGLDTVNDLYGRTANPLGPFTPGGSSGGEAAAVAAGFSAFGIGSDFGGSLRWPAQCASLIGLRPTVGRVPGTGQLPGTSDDVSVPDRSTLQGLVQVIGPLARSVREAAAVLSALAGPDGLDPAATSTPLLDPGDVDFDAVEIRWGTTVAGLGVDAQVAAAVETAATVLGRRATVRPGLPPAVDAAAPLYSALRAADPLVEIRRVAGRGECVGDYLSSLLRDAPDHDPGLMSELLAERARLVAELSRWLHGDRLLLLPVAVVPPFDPGALPVARRGRLLTGFDLVTPCRAISLFGLPAISVPCGHTSGGRPLSVQLVAPADREDLVLAAARVIEQAG